MQIINVVLQQNNAGTAVISTTIDATAATLEVTVSVAALSVKQLGVYPEEIQAEILAHVAGQNPHGQYALSADLGTAALENSGAFEPAAGNPSADEYVLSSSASGQRTWVPKDSGPQGPAGPAGPAGADGPQGPQGPAGSDGAPGATGQQGLTGETGPAGPQGPAGVDGVAGSAGADGLSAYEVAVANGYSGSEVQWLASLVGPQGAAGVDGINGIDGQDGADGTAVDIAVEVHAAAGKTTIADADEFALVDSAATYTLKKLTGAYLKSGIASYCQGLTTWTANRLNLISNALLETPLAGYFEYSDPYFYATVVAPDSNAYPPAFNTTYVKATNVVNGAAYLSTDPSMAPFTGSLTGKAWFSSASTNQRFMIDLGSEKVIESIYYQNGLNNVSGTIIVSMGAQDFTLWFYKDDAAGASAFSSATWKTDAEMVTAGWTRVYGDVAKFAQHTAADVEDPKTIALTNTQAYRYCSINISTNYGRVNQMSLRHVRLLTGGDAHPRKQVLLNNGVELTQGSMPVATAYGRLIDSAISVSTAGTLNIPTGQTFNINGTPHVHDYAASDHTHDYSSVYAASNHTHDYSAIYAALNHAHDYEPVLAAGTSAQYYRGDKTWQALSQAAIDGLTVSSSPLFAGLGIGCAKTAAEYVLIRPPDAFDFIYVRNSAGVISDRKSALYSTQGLGLSTPPLVIGNGDNLPASLYIGNDIVFSDISIGIDSATSGVGYTLGATYWNGTAWAELTLAADTTTNLIQSGVLSFTPPANWTKASLNTSTGAMTNAEGGAYYMRLFTTTTATTQPWVKAVLPSASKLVQYFAAFADTSPAFEIDALGRPFFHNSVIIAAGMVDAASSQANLSIQSNQIYSYLEFINNTTVGEGPTIKGQVSDLYVTSPGGSTIINDFATIGATAKFGSATNYSEFEANGTLCFHGDATVFDDFQIAVATGKVPANNAPTWAAFYGNLYNYTFAVDDFIYLEATEFMHAWKEASAIEVHVHWATNGLNDATARGVKWEVEYAWANMQSAGGTIVFAGSSGSAETAIAANEAALTHKYTSVLTFTPTGGKVGAQLILRLKRIASTAAAPASNPFCLAVGCHYEKDTIGSRTVTAK